jgi:hypothetical protein
MTESSRLRDRWVGDERPVVTQHCPQHIDAAACQRQDCLSVDEPFRTFPQVVLA